MAANDKPIVIGVPQQVGRLLELAAELAALDWVQTHTPELHDDPVARRELAARIAEAERQLRADVARVVNGDAQCEWFAGGTRLTISTQSDLARTLSDLCDRSFSQAPAILNELINRRSLSAAAAAARRNLLEAMVERAGEVQLGFEGTPPEISMYRAVLERHGIHALRRGGWSLGKPTKSGPGSLVPAWTAIVETLEKANESRVKLDALAQYLRRPPYGLKDGVIPVLLVAALLGANAEVAVYEEGSFVPALTGAVVERLARASDRFEVQLVRVSGVRDAVLRALGAHFGEGAGPEAYGIVSVVRQLIKVVRDVPEYSRKTKRISPSAMTIRQAVLGAREPGPLLFVELPRACGIQPLPMHGRTSESTAKDLVERVISGLSEVQAAYAALLRTVEDAVREALHLPADTDELRAELAVRAERIFGLTADAHLKSFLNRVKDTVLPQQDWLASVGTLLCTKPPSVWNDEDLDHARVNLRHLAHRFVQLEAMVAGRGPEPLPGGTTLMRISISRSGDDERERVVALRRGDAKRVAAICARLKSAVASPADSASREAVLAALALVAREILAEVDPVFSETESKS